MRVEDGGVNCSMAQWLSCSVRHCFNQEMVPKGASKEIGCASQRRRHFRWRYNLLLAGNKLKIWPGPGPGPGPHPIPQRKGHKALISRLLGNAEIGLRRRYANIAYTPPTAICQSCKIQRNAIKQRIGGTHPSPNPPQWHHSLLRENVQEIRLAVVWLAQLEVQELEKNLRENQKHRAQQSKYYSFYVRWQLTFQFSLTCIRQIQSRAILLRMTCSRISAGTSVELMNPS